MNIEKHRAARVRIIRHVAFAAAQLPHEPRIYRTGKDLSVFRAFTHAFDVVQNPFDFRTGKIRVGKQARFFADHVPLSRQHQFIGEFGRSAALPYDGAVHGLSRHLIPQYDRFPLIRYADSRNLPFFYAGAPHGFSEYRKLTQKQFFGIVFDPAGLRIILIEFLLRACNLIRPVIEHDSPRRRRSLIERNDIFFFGHSAPPRCNCHYTTKFAA